MNERLPGDEADERRGNERQAGMSCANLVVQGRGPQQFPLNMNRLRHMDRSGMKTTEELFDLRGKVALVDSGSRGIGEPYPRALPRRADVVIASRVSNREAAAGDRTLGQPAASSSLRVWMLPTGRNCDRAVESVHRELVRCDVLVKNACKCSGLRQPDLVY